jgi:hypothetical protein
VAFKQNGLIESFARCLIGLINTGSTLLILKSLSTASHDPASGRQAREAILKFIKVKGNPN